MKNPDSFGLGSDNFPESAISMGYRPVMLGVESVGLFDDFSRFLEDRLDEFLRNNPHLELQAIEEQLQEQELDTRRLIQDLQAQERRLEEEILATGQEVQRWHLRIEKAKVASRQDLVQPAQEREAALLRQGNQLWGQMQGVKQRITQSQELLQQIQTRRQEVKAKAAAAQAAKAQQAKSTASSATSGWNNYTQTSRNPADPLEAQFSNWEAQEELDQMKRNLGR